MTPREAFISARQPRWNRLERLLAHPTLRDGASLGELAELYRALCADVAKAQAMDTGEDIRAYLEELAGRAHNRLYGVRPSVGFRLTELIGRDIPREIRRSWVYFLLASLLFYGPLGVGVVGAIVDPDFAATVLPPDELAQMESMYMSPDLARGAGEDALMAGFYVQHNVGIAFRCFATGIFAGLGSVFFLVFNGLVIGTVLGHIASAGYAANLLAFICGHSAWELTGIVLGGTGGLRLGWALIDTQGRTRLGSLRANRIGLFRLAIGSAVLLLVAASVEGFWSAGPMPHPVKYAFGAIQVVIVTAWILFAGRGEP